MKKSSQQRNIGKVCLVSFSKKDNYSSKNKLDGFDSNSPKWAYIEITNSCSHKCAWCYGEFNVEKSDFMSVSEFEMIADKCLEIGIEQITLSGGEPTRHPDFEEIMSIACVDFDVNIATHGDWDKDWSGLMMINGIKQVQFNYQGRKRHDNIHKVESYLKQIKSMASIKAVGIDVVGTVTVGKYNLKDIASIFKELDEMEVSRIRVWESTGRGSGFLKDKTAKEIFDICQTEAREIGYTFTQSYDPVFQGDIGVACLSLSKLYVYIKADSSVIFCGAVTSERDKSIANFKHNTAQEIKDRYIAYMDSKNCGTAYCMARNDNEIELSMVI